MPEKETGSLCVDIREDNLLALSAEVLGTLLRDHTTGDNIFWATHDYEALGSEYDYHSQILPHLITGEHGMVIRPRVLKSKELQTDRSKGMAEVFTPSWICNAQNKLVDEALPKNMDWKDYVRLTCLEIACGEAPYLVSRYDTTTGRPIPLEERIGLLDRKLSVVSAHTETCDEWLEWAQTAYKNIYGFEWQGDNLLLAREALFWTFIEYYQAKFQSAPTNENINAIADIISWNLWQMDGLTGGLPDHEVQEDRELSLFLPPVENCFCRIYDWENNKKIRYVDLIR